MAEKAKVYGLILPGKKSEQIKAKAAQPAFNVFGSDSDEDKKPIVRGSIFGQNTGPSKIKRQAQVDIDKALKEDPNIYEYDAVYDEMQASKPKVGAKDKDKSSADKKPKYIMGLLKAADHKKKEEERRKERKVQKEREAEGDKFADKEKFVTSAYKQKMLEMQEEEEKEKRETAFEAMTDVTKQKDMSGFYRYLYRETTGDQVKSDESTQQKPKETGSSEVKVEPDESPRQKPQPSPGSPSSSSESASPGNDSEIEATVSKNGGGLFKSNRPNTGNIYRKRKADSSDSDENRGKTEGKKTSRSQKRHSLSRSKSRSPRRSKNDQNYSRKNGSPGQVLKHRRSKSHSPSPVIDRRERDKSRSRERTKKEHRSREGSRKNKHKRSKKKSKRSRQASREKLRKSRSRSREKTRRSRSRSKEKSRKSRSASREKLRKSRSRSREKSRSQSRDRSKKIQISSSRSNIEGGEHSKSDYVGLRRKHNPSRSPSSGDDHEKEQLSHKSTDKIKKSERLGKAEIKEKDKSIEKSQKAYSELSNTSQKESNTSQGSGKESNTSKASGKEDSMTAEKDQAGKSGNVNTEEAAVKPLPVDPAKKVYPHHNSLKDIEEARKRYLQRKAAREGVA